MCQPANLTSNLSAGIKLTPYLTHVHWHMFPTKSENVTARCHTFGGVHKYIWLRKQLFGAPYGGGNYYYIQVLRSAVIPAYVADILSREWMSLQTFERSREINKKDMARVWVLFLAACITSNCPTMSRSDKHLVIVKAWKSDQLSGKKVIQNVSEGWTNHQNSTKWHLEQWEREFGSQRHPPWWNAQFENRPTCSQSSWANRIGKGKECIPCTPNAPLNIDTQTVTVCAFAETFFKGINENSTIFNLAFAIIIRIYFINQRICQITKRFWDQQFKRNRIEITYKVFSSGLQPRPFES